MYHVIFRGVESPWEPGEDCETLHEALLDCVQQAFYSAVSHQVTKDGKLVFAAMFQDHDDVKQRGWMLIVPAGSDESDDVMSYLGRFALPEKGAP